MTSPDPSSSDQQTGQLITCSPTISWNATYVPPEAFPAYERPLWVAICVVYLAGWALGLAAFFRFRALDERVAKRNPVSAVVASLSGVFLVASLGVREAVGRRSYPCDAYMFLTLLLSGCAIVPLLVETLVAYNAHVRNVRVLDLLLPLVAHPVSVSASTVSPSPTSKPRAAAPRFSVVASPALADELNRLDAQRRAMTGSLSARARVGLVALRRTLLIPFRIINVAPRRGGPGFASRSFAALVPAAHAEAGSAAAESPSAAAAADAATPAATPSQPHKPPHASLDRQRRELLVWSASSSDAAAAALTIILVLPFALIGCVIYATNDVYHGCTGCEIALVPDTVTFFCLFAVFAALTTLANRRLARFPDPLGIRVSVVWGGLTALAWLLLSVGLALADPGRLNKRGAFHWGFFEFVALASLQYFMCVWPVVESVRQSRAYAAGAGAGARVEQDGARDKALDASRPPPLDRVLADERLRAKLEEWLAHEFAIESLLFLYSVAAFEDAFVPGDDAGNRKRAQDVYDVYVPYDASFSVNVPDGVVARIQARLAATAEPLPQSVFEEAREEIVKLVETGALRRFWLHLVRTEGGGARGLVSGMSAASSSVV